MTINRLPNQRQQVTLSWNAVSGATSYKLRTGIASGSYGSTAIVGNVAGYTQTSLTNGTPYYFVLIASNAGGDSVPSDEVSATPHVANPPPVPQLTQAKAGNAKVLLTWSAAAGADSYRIYYGTSSGSYASSLDGGTGTTLTVTNLINPTKYYFAVTAKNSAGESAKSNELSATPSAPVNVDVISNVEYNAANFKTKVENGNGAVTTYEYFANQRLKRIVTRDGNGATLQDLEYTYDGAGNILKIADHLNNKEENFIYDELGRLAQATGAYATGGTLETQTFQYDAIGNIQNKNGIAYSYDPSGVRPHAVTALGAETYTYDTNGNMSRKTVSSSTTDYVYDIENRLNKILDNNITTAQYSYDDAGQRTKKIANNTTTIFVGDHYESRSAGKTDHVYLDGLRVASVDNGEVVYYHSNHLGSVNVITDDVGRIKDTVEYTPFGEFARHDGSSQEGRFYTDQYRDQESGLYYYRRIAEEGSPFIKEGGFLFLEIGEGQAAPIEAIFLKKSLRLVEVRKDISETPRVMIFRKGFHG